MPKPHERKRLARIARRQEDQQETTTDPNAPTPHKPLSKQPRPYRLEYRLRPELWEKYRASRLFLRDMEWRRWYSSYATEKARDQALAIMNNKDRLWEYRIEQTKTPLDGGV